MFLIDSGLLIVSIGLTIIGGGMIYEFFATKRKWMKDRLTSKMNNKSATLIFEDHQIQSIGPFTELIGKWDFFTDVIETDKGVF